VLRMWRGRNKGIGEGVGIGGWLVELDLRFGIWDLFIYEVNE
jgi:hypothetical protein